MKIILLNHKKRKNLKIITDKTELSKIKRKVNTLSDKAKLPRKYRPIPLKEIEKELKSRGVEDEDLIKAKQSTRSLSRSRSKSREFSKLRTPSEQRNLFEINKREDSTKKDSLLGKRKKKRSISSSRTLTPGGTKAGIVNIKQQIGAIKLGYKKQKSLFVGASKKGESDRVIPDMKPKHLFTGKRGIGKTERR